MAVCNYTLVKVWQPVKAKSMIGRSRIFVLGCGHTQRRFLSEGMFKQMRCWECEDIARQEAKLQEILERQVRRGREWHDQ